MNNKRDSAESLRQEIKSLKEMIELGDDILPIEWGFPKLLKELDDSLADEKLDVDKLEQHAFGIFRLVTESYEFEQSSLGKQLMEIRTKIKNLSRS